MITFKLSASKVNSSNERATYHPIEKYVSLDRMKLNLNLLDSFGTEPSTQ